MYNGIRKRKTRWCTISVGIRCPKCQSSVSEAYLKCPNCGNTLRPPRSGLEYTHSCDICKSYRGTRRVKVTQPKGQVVEGFMCDLCRGVFPEGFKVELWTHNIHLIPI